MNRPSRSARNFSPSGSIPAIAPYGGPGRSSGAALDELCGFREVRDEQVLDDTDRIFAVRESPIVMSRNNGACSTVCAPQRRCPRVPRGAHLDDAPAVRQDDVGPGVRRTTASTVSSRPKSAPDTSAVPYGVCRRAPAWVIPPAGRGAIRGRREPGRVTLRWHGPGRTSAGEQSAENHPFHGCDEFRQMGGVSAESVRAPGEAENAVHGSPQRGGGGDGIEVGGE